VKVEVLRDIVVLRPDLAHAVDRVDEYRVLDRGPPEELIVADESGDLAVGADHRNRPVDAAGEVRDAALEAV
jgi:hypothetical protein